MEAYIRSTAAISPQDTFVSNSLPEETAVFDTARLKCIEPDYKEYINPSLIRRMSRIVKMGVASAIKCLKEAETENPDAIITGTGLGCMEDTGNFLTSIINNQEQFLTPTAFIQSTHNTISGQIALMLKCNNYNFAYVHRGFSFENALLDAMMMLHSDEAQKVLLGGIDEITDDYFNITNRMGLWKQGNIDSSNLLKSKNRGSIAGEGAAFFVLQQKPESAMARFRAVEMIFHPQEGEIEKKILAMLESKQLQMNDIDAVMLGLNGWKSQDELYKPLQNGIFAGKTQWVFKHLCGEYMTAGSFAAWLASSVLHEQKVPQGIHLMGPPPEKLSNILIYNHFMGTEHSLILLSAC